MLTKMPANVKEKAPKKEAEVLPDLRDLVTGTAPRLQILRLSTAVAAINAEEAILRRSKKPLVDKLKDLLVDHGIDKAAAGDIRIVFYDTSRKTLSTIKLMANGVPAQVIADSYEVKSVKALKVSRAGEEEEDE